VVERLCFATEYEKRCRSVVALVPLIAFVFMVDLGMEWEDVMSYRVHIDRIVVIEGPVGFKRTWWFPEAGRKG
jgi:hypothetical protein